MWPTAWRCFPQLCCSMKWPRIFWITPIFCLSESIWDVVTWNPNNPNLYTHFGTWAIAVAAQDLSRWQSLFLSSKAVGSAITDCLLSAGYVLTKCRATKDKRPKFKETGECWLTFINWSMVLRKKEKKRPLQFDPLESRTEKLQEESKFKRNACCLHVWDQWLPDNHVFFHE